MSDLLTDLDDTPEGTVVRCGALFYRKHGDVWRLLVMSGSMSHVYARPDFAETVYEPEAERRPA